MTILSGCGSSGMSDTAEYLHEIRADKYVTLGEYKGIEINIASSVVTETDIEGYIAYLMMTNPMLIESNGPSAVGDEVNIDFLGKVDGVAFEGGSAEGYTYTLGSYQFIGDLDEGMVGMNVGDVRDIPVTFPDPYQNNPDLSGALSIFTVTMNSIMTPEENAGLTDEYVAWLMSGEMNTVADFRASIEEELRLEAQAAYDTELSNLIADTVMGNAEIKSVPSGYVRRISNSLTSTLSYYASMYGMDLKSYLVAFGMITSDQDPAVIITEQAEASAKHYLTYQAIADIEGLNVSDEEAEAEIAKMAAEYGITVDEYKEGMDVEGYKEYLMLMKVSDFLLANAVVIHI
jgi:trigger factor